MPDSWAPTDCSLSASSGIFPGKNTGVGCHILFQGILQIQGLNLCLLHCKHIFYHLSYQGSPHVMIKKKNKTKHETWLRPFRLKFSLNLFPMSLPMLLFPLRIVWKPSPSFFIFFPCILLFWLTYHDLLVKWEKKTKTTTPVALEGFLPTEFNSEGCESFRKGWCPEPSALLGQTGRPHLWWAGFPGFNSSLAPVAMFRIEHQTTYEDGIDELQKLYAQFIRPLTITRHCNVLNPPSMC